MALPWAQLLHTPGSRPSRGGLGFTRKIPSVWICAEEWFLDRVCRLISSCIRLDPIHKPITDT